MNVPVRTRKRRTRRFDAQGGSESSGNADLFDLEVLLGVLRDGRNLIFGGAILCMIVAFVVLRMTPPSYEAHSELILDTRQERATPVESVMSNLSVSNAVVAGEVLAIRSNLLVGRVVDRLNLVEDPAFDPRQPGPESILERVRRTVTGGDALYLQAMALSEAELRELVIEEIQLGLTASQVGISYAMQLSFRSHDPRAAQLIANELAQEYIDSQLEREAQLTDRATAWLSARIEELSQQVQETEAAVVAFRTQMATEAGGAEETTSQLLTELHSRLVETSAERADAEVRYELVQTLLSETGIRAAADVVTSPLLETLTRERAAMEAERAELATTYGRLHPDMVFLTAQIEEMDRSIEAEVQRRVEAMRSDVLVAVSREEALKRQIEDVSVRANELSQSSVRLEQLEREAQATRSVYEEFLSRFKETSARGDFQVAEARLLSRAALPGEAASSQIILHLLVAGVLGASLGTALVFLRNLLMPPIRTSRELRRLSGRPVLSLVPYVSTFFGGKYQWLRRELKNKSRVSPFFEAIRTLDTQIFGMGSTRPPRSLMVTSSLAREGKSTLCYALARVQSDHGRRVVILDADLRRPDSVSALGIRDKAGCLGEALSSDVSNPRKLIMRSELIGADVVAPLKPATNPAQLLAKPALSGIVTALMTQYDLVIINAPPAANLSDTLILTQYADVTVFAVKSSATPAKVVEATLARLENAGAFIVGTVMTQVRRGHLAGREVYEYAYY